MVDAEQVHDGGLEVVHMHRIPDDVVAEVVGLAVDRARLCAAARHPNREAARMMVAAVFGCSEAALAINGASELPAPYDQRVIEHAPLFEILHETCGRLIGFLAALGHTCDQSAVVIPIAMIKLDEAHAALGKATCEQAVRGEGPGLLHVGAV